MCTYMGISAVRACLTLLFSDSAFLPVRNLPTLILELGVGLDAKESFVSHQSRPSTTLLAIRTPQRPKPLIAQLRPLRLVLILQVNHMTGSGTPKLLTT